MESRPLRHALAVAGHSLNTVLRWPLDHLVPTYTGILGTNETVLQVCVTINFIIAIGLLLAGYRIKSGKNQDRPIRIGIHANYCFVSTLNILTRLPKKFDLLSTARSYLLLISICAQLLTLFASFSDHQTDRHFCAVIHFSFIIDSLLLSGLWQSITTSIDQGDGLSCAIIWLSLFMWILVGFLLQQKGDNNKDQSKQTNISLDDKEDNKDSLTMTREILVGSIDTIVILFLQYG